MAASGGIFSSNLELRETRAVVYYGYTMIFLLWWKKVKTVRRNNICFLKRINKIKTGWRSFVFWLSAINYYSDK